MTVSRDLADLSQLAPPPAAPVANDQLLDRWEGQTGLGLPAGYVALLEKWGSGVFYEWVRVYSPAGRFGLVQLNDAATANLLVSGADAATWPDEGGLIVWGTTVDGDYLCFDPADGDPELWPLVMLDVYGDRVFEHRGTVPGFLAGLLTAALEGSGEFGLGETEPGEWDGVAAFEPVDWES